jgi:hypothetical protein
MCLLCLIGERGALHCLLYPYPYNDTKPTPNTVFLTYLHICIQHMCLLCLIGERGALHRLLYVTNNY